MSESIDRFTSHVACEFRTPLRAIKEYASILRDGLVGPLNDQQRELVSIIDTRADDLTCLIDDILDASKLKTGVLSVWRRATNIGHMIEQIRPMLARKAESRRIDLEIALPDDLPDVYCDPDTTGRALVSLTEAAVHLCGKSGQMQLWTQFNPGEFELTVGVTVLGLNIDSQRLGQVLDVVGRDSKDLLTSEDSFAVRMGIARELICLNLGEIRFDSEADGRYSLHFRIPTVDPQHLVVRHADRRKSSSETSLPATLVVVRIDPSVEPEAFSLADEFLHRAFRATDLVVQSVDHKWVVVADCGGSDVEKMIRRVRGVWTEARHRHPLGMIPEIDFSVLGTWSWETGSAKLTAAFQRELSMLAPHSSKRFNKNRSQNQMHERRAERAVSYQSRTSITPPWVS